MFFTWSVENRPGPRNVVDLFQGLLTRRDPPPRSYRDPIHLTVDAPLSSGRMSARAFVRASIGVPGGTKGSMFTPVPTEVAADDAPEVAAGLDLLHKTKFTKLRQVEPLPDLPRVSEGVTKLELMLDAVIKVGFVVFCLL